jgi:hypothetical protein
MGLPISTAEIGVKRPPSPLTKNKRQPKLPCKLRQWRTKKLPRRTGRGPVLDHAAFSSPGFLGDVQQWRLVILGQKAVDRRQRIRTETHLGRWPLNRADVAAVRILMVDSLPSIALI